MNMTPQEIAKEYREAKDKVNQITILADENVTDRETIIKILQEQGEATDKVPKARGRKRAKAEPGAAVSAQKEKAKEVADNTPESVINDCQRELVFMQQQIDEDESSIEMMETSIKQLKERIKENERQMKEITEFCRRK